MDSNSDAFIRYCNFHSLASIPFETSTQNSIDDVVTLTASRLDNVKTSTQDCLDDVHNVYVVYYNI